MYYRLRNYYLESGQTRSAHLPNVAFVPACKSNVCRPWGRTIHPPSAKFNSLIQSSDCRFFNSSLARAYVSFLLLKSVRSFPNFIFEKSIITQSKSTVKIQPQTWDPNRPSCSSCSLVRLLIAILWMLKVSILFFVRS